MFKNKEFRQFTVGYWCMVLLFLLLLEGVNWFYWQEREYGSRSQVMELSLVFFGITVSFGVLGYAVGYICFSCLYRRLSAVSKEMGKCTVTDVDFPMTREYEFTEGELGILVSNYHLLVQALREAKKQEMKEKCFLKETISDISHQLKTPLASLTVFLDLLIEEKLPEKEEEKRVLREAQNQLQRMEWMVLSMLKLARLEVGAIVFETVKTPLYPMLLGSINSLRPRYEDKEQQVTLSCPEDAVLVMDGDWMQEAVVNILKNAVDYTPRKGEIRIVVEQNKIYTRIYIADTGMGISPEDLSHIFERFHRGSNNVNSNSVGIGLSLAKSIIEGQGGRIHVDSELSLGTQFTITFVTEGGSNKK